jgi:hypothetical protein
VESVESGNLKSILEEVRKTETPGKRGVFAYAGAIYRYFEDIRELKAEGFSLVTICKFLAEKGILPINYDTHSFRRAFQREAARRRRVENSKGGVRRAAIKNVSTGNAAKREIPAIGAEQEPRDSSIPPEPLAGKAGVQINPDNTFTIRPIDPDDLPDIKI